MATLPDETPSLFPDLPLDAPGSQGRRAGAAGAGADVRVEAGVEAGVEVGPTTPSEELTLLGQSLPSMLYLGTSSWSFPGWTGLVYDRDAGESLLARKGLAAYARHPLFRSVGVDKTFYRPAPRAEFERLAAQVPTGFRFLVKIWRGIVERDVRGTAGSAGAAADAFLDARVAEVECIRPAIEGLGDKAGPLLFQFPPMHLGGGRAHRGFLAQLANFLGALPKGPLYAVELRNRSLVSPEYAARLGELLAEHGVAPCLTVHPTMPDVETQSRELALNPSLPLVMRWMLRRNQTYGEAKDLYAPFDKLAEPDDASRNALARLAKSALHAGLGAWVIVNNKAEGSSPLSVERLAKAIVD
jgi:uncharacterized protein YecE (DUF72 family)